MRWNMLWIIKDTNADATKYYLNVIEKSAVMAKQHVRQVDNVNDAKSGDKTDIYLVTTPIDAVKIYLQGKRRIIIWFQGVFSEESYLKHKSIIRRSMLRFIEKFILKKALFVFFVSKEMHRYYTELFNVNLEKKYYIMPCFNTELKKDSFMDKDKYKNNIFCYAGSLSIWQGFDKILACYKQIEKRQAHETQLLILTHERDKAKKLLKEAEITNYEIDYVSLEELPKILKRAKFGFILRDNIIVNRVSTPTKISTYTANGIIPIYSDCLVDFHNKTKDKKFVLSYNDKDFKDKLMKLMTEDINTEEIHEEYLDLFKTYFNVDYHVERIADKMKNVF
jgi:hypothetical protein